MSLYDQHNSNCKGRDKYVCGYASRGERAVFLRHNTYLEYKYFPLSSQLSLIIANIELLLRYFIKYLKLSTIP